MDEKTVSTQCSFCDFGSTYEYEANDHFQYGVDDDAVMLCARVTVIACARCSMKYTDYRSEDSRQKVVEEHLEEEMKESKEMMGTFHDSLKQAAEKSQLRYEQLDDFYKDRVNFKKFTIKTYELKEVLDWKIEHNKTCPYYDDGTKTISPQGAIGGRTTYNFTPTSIGMAVSVSCACGAKKNITDYDSW